MIVEFKLPELGENIEGGTVIKVAVSQGDTVSQDQTLLELETDKAAIDVPAPDAGVITEVLVKEGEEIKVGQTIIKINTDAQAAPIQEEPKKAEKPAAKETPKKKEPAPVAPEVPTPTPAPAVAQAAAMDGKDIPAAPSVRRFAREIGINVAEVPGSGPGGRISKDDVKAYAKQLLTSSAPSAGGIAASQPPLPDFAKWGPVERTPMSNVRKATARNLNASWSTVPHVTQFDKTDITDLEALRKKHSTKDLKLTITPFLLKVIASALKVFPQFCASIDMTTQEIIYKKYCHIGVAVDTDRGLIVPVIRDVDQKNVLDIARELIEVSERARNRKTSLEEMKGGCFTMTNLGGIGGTSFTPIVNAPEVAILGVSRASLEPNSFGQPRLILPLSLSYDHRVIDGADGARFLRWICEAIHQPFLMEIQK